MSPPIYPTRASYSPFPLNSFLNICSTPQKQPAAIVAFSAPAGEDIGPTAVIPRDVEVVNGRRRR